VAQGHGAGLADTESVAASKSRIVNAIGHLLLCASILAPSRLAKAEQETSQNLNVEVQVTRPCTVSSERGLGGIELDSGCPTSIKQTVLREFVVDPTSATSAVTERLVLVVNF
jgi:hypothetical protein